MRVSLLLLILVYLVGCNASTPSKSQAETKPLSDVEMGGLRTVEKLGRIIYEKDVHAANATDLLLGSINPADYPNFVGWVTYPNESGYTVSFYSRDADSYSVISDVVYGLSSEPELIINPDRSISYQEKSMIDARIRALQVGKSDCSDRFNSVVLEGENPNQWDVYILAATTDPNAVMVGGNAKVSISKDTGEIVSSTPLSKSCLVLNKKPDDMPEGASLAMLTMTHIVSDYPVAIHPYLNLMHEIPFAVMTKRGLWIVENGKIELNDRK
ncbi:hypothetical protein [Microbulbifer aggregans]|uniref:hypothetical protein n=1 Tax=Microbulbifer aggregans TaxID=1769779 RepID=UPI001CFDAF24|nr:hypothetical protein [Microbulbifer aggregans]